MKLSANREIPLHTHECIDSFLNGKLHLIQSKDGYRFSIDAALLSDFIEPSPTDIVLDLGTGCGIILCMMLLTKSVKYALGLEIQEELASQAARNILLNGFQKKMAVIHGDIRHWPLKRGSVDRIVCNPPFRKAKSGRINPDRRRAIARHELLISIEDILSASRSILKKKGRLAMIYPSVRLVELLIQMRRFNFEPKKIQIVYPSVKSNAKMVLIEASLGGQPGVEICPAIFGQGSFSI